jgi:hypothetical protein
VRLSGFTIVRNAKVLDYPFRESVLSILPFCDEVIINCGDSEDGTESVAAELQAQSPNKIRVIHSVWQREDQKGGWQLKAQSDSALAECKGEWCLYIQADEVMHETDLPNVFEAMEKADKRSDIDGILFDYLHFYGNYDYQITGRNWYRREVRAFKNGRGISAYRDAQGFRKNDEKLRVLKSGARVFHYGYVRSPGSMEKKNTQMAQWWGEKPATESSAFELRRHIGLKRFRESHPAVMKERLHQPPTFDPKSCPRRWNRDEIKNAITFVWESIVPYRIGEFRNYELVR